MSTVLNIKNKMLSASGNESKTWSKKRQLLLNVRVGHTELTL